MAEKEDLIGIPKIPVIAELPSGGQSPYQAQREASPEAFDPHEITMKSSVYDKGLIANPEDMAGSIMEHRGETQPWQAKIGAGLAKGVVMAGTTFADSFVGLGAGLLTEGAHLAGLTDKGFNDNIVTQTLMGLQTKSEEWFPNYRTKEEEAMNPLQKLATANFWGDGILKNLGMGIGAFAAGMVGNELGFAKMLGSAKEAGALFSEIGVNGEKGILQKILTAGQQGEILAKDGKVLSTEQEIMNAYRSNNLASETVENAIVKSAGRGASLNMWQKMIGTAFAGQGQARFFATQTYNDYKSKATEEELQKLQYNSPGREVTEKDLSPETLASIEHQSKVAMNVDFGLVLPLVMFTEMVQWGKYLGRGFKIESQIAGKLDYYKGAVKGNLDTGLTLQDNFLNKALIAGKIAKRPIVSAVDLQLQTGAGSAAEEFVKRQNDPEAGDTLQNFVEGIGKGLSESFGTKGGWDSFILGAVTGLIGTPTFGVGGTKFLSGGLWDSMGEASQEKQFVKKQIDYLQTHKDLIGILAKSAQAHLSFEQAKKDAIDNKNEFTYHTANDAQFVNLISTLHSLGRYDEAIKNMKDFQSFNEKDLKDFHTVKTDNGEPLPEDKWIKPFENKPTGELKQETDARINNLVKFAEDIRKYKEVIDTKFQNVLSDPEKEQLIHDMSMAKSYDNRTDAISKELSDNGFKDGRTVAELHNEAVKLNIEEGGLNRLHQKRAALKKSIKTLEDHLTSVTRDTLDSSLSIKERDAIPEKTAELKKRVDDLKKEYKEALDEQHSKHSKEIDRLGGIEEYSYEEYVQKVEALDDKQTEFNSYANHYFTDNPQLKDDAKKLLEDLGKVQRAKTASLEHYITAIDRLRNGKNTLAESYKKVTDNLANRELKLKIKRYEDAVARNKDGIKLVDTKTGDEVILKRVGDDYMLSRKTTDGTYGPYEKVELNKAFKDNYLFPKEAADIVAKGVSTQAATSDLGTTRSVGTKKQVGAIKVKYSKEGGEEKEYIAIPIDPDHYRLFHPQEDGSIIAHRGGSFVVDKTKTTISDKEVKFYEFQGDSVIYNPRTGKKQVSTEYIMRDQKGEDSFIERIKKAAGIKSEGQETEEGETPEEIEDKTFKERPAFRVKKEGKKEWEAKYPHEDFTQSVLQEDPEVLSKAWAAYNRGDKDGATVIVNGEKYQVIIPPYEPSGEKPVKVAIRYVLKKNSKPVIKKTKEGKEYKALSYKTYIFENPEDIEGMKFHKDGIVTFKDDEGRMQEGRIEFTQMQDEDIPLIAVGKEGGPYFSSDFTGTLRSVLKTHGGGRIIPESIVETTVKAKSQTGEAAKEIQAYKLTVEYHKKNGEAYTIDFYMLKPKELVSKDSVMKDSRLSQFTVMKWNSLKNIEGMMDGNPVSNGGTGGGNLVDPETESGHIFGKNPLPTYKEGVMAVSTGVSNIRAGSGITLTNGKTEVLLERTLDTIDRIEREGTSDEKADLRFERFNNAIDITNGKFKVVVRELTAGEIKADNAFEGKGKFIFITNEKGEYLGEDGKRLDNQGEHVYKGIWKALALPTSFNQEVQVSSEDPTKFTIHDNRRAFYDLNPDYVAPHEKKADLQKELANYNTWYASLADGMTIPVKGKTQGVPVLTAPNEAVPSHTILPLDRGEFKLIVGKDKGQIAVGNMDYKVPLGHTCYVDKKTGNIIETQPRGITPEESNLVVQLLNHFVSKIDAEGKIPDKASKIKARLESEETSEAGRVKGEEDIIERELDLFKDGIERIVYMQSRNNIDYQSFLKLEDTINKYKIEKDKLSVNGEKGLADLDNWMNNEIARIVSEGRENKNPNTQLYLTNSMFEESGDGTFFHRINIGGKLYPLINTETKSLPEETKNALLEHLTNRTLQIPSKIARDNDMNRIMSMTGEGDDALVTAKHFGDGQKYMADNTVTRQRLDKLSRVGQQLLLSQHLKPGDKSDVGDNAKSTQDELAKLFAGKTEAETQINLKELAKLIPAFKVDGSALATNLGKESSEENPNAPSFEDLTKTNAPVIKDGVLTNPTTGKPFEPLFREGKPGHYIVENTEAAKDWVQDKFGGKVSMDKLDELVHQGKFGMFHAATIYLAENAEIGTTYHEAFHAVTHMFLKDSEVKNLYDEFRKRTENKGQSFTDKQIEEKLAEEFRDYELSDGKMELSKVEPVKKGFFRRMLDLVRSFLGFKKSGGTIEDVYQKLHRGYYSEQPSHEYFGEGLGRDVELKFSDKSYEFHRSAMKAMSNYFMQHLLKNRSTNLIFDLFTKGGVTGEKIDAALEDVKSKFLANINTPVGESNKYITENWDRAKELFSDYLKSEYGLELQRKEKYEDYQVGEDNSALTKTEDQKEGGRGSEYDYDSLKVSSKASAAKIVRLFLGTLPKGDMVTFEGKRIFIPKFDPIFGAPEMVDFGDSFSILISKLSGKSGMGSILNALKQLESHPKLGWLDFVTGSHSRLKINDNPLSWTQQDVGLISKFFQAFTKAKNNFLVMISDKSGEYNLVDANYNNLSRRIFNTWQGDVFTRLTKNDKFLIRTKNNRIYYNAKNLQETFPSGIDRENVLPFLNTIGVQLKYIPEDPTIRDTFLKKAQAMYVDLIRRDGTSDKSVTPFLFTQEESTNLGKASSKKSDLGFFLDTQTKDPNEVDLYENGHYNLHGDYVYDSSAHAFYSKTVAELNEIREGLIEQGITSKEQVLSELRARLPHLNDPYNRNSVLLDRVALGIPLSLSIIEGSREASYSEGKDFVDLSSTDRIRAWYAAFSEGRFVMSRPSDNGKEMFLTTEHFLKDSEIEKGYGDYMWKYLIDEVSNRVSVKNDPTTYTRVQDNLYKGILIDIFSPKNNPELHKIITEAINGKYENIESTLRGTENVNYDQFILGFRRYFNAQRDNLIDKFVELGLIEPSKDRYINHGLAIKDGDGKVEPDLSSENLRADVKKFVLEHFMSQVEQTKIFTGDVLFSKDLPDKFKRNQGANSPKNVSMDHPLLNRAIANVYKRSDLKHRTVDPDAPATVKTAIFQDVDVRAPKEFLSSLRSILDDPSDVKAYESMTEGDGGSVISPDESRETLVRNGQWGDDLEKAWQWDMQKYLGRLVKQDKFSKEDFKEIFGHDNYSSPQWEGRDLNQNESKIAMHVLKLQHYGPLADVDGMKINMLKSAFMINMPSFFMDWDNMEVTKPNLEALFTRMRENQIGILSTSSSAKGGTNKMSDTNTFYEDAKDFKLSKAMTGKIPIITQDIYYKNIGVQQDTGFSPKNHVVFGTQMIKQIRAYIHNAGLGEIPELTSALRNLDSLNDHRLQMGVQQLKDKLGLKQTLTGDYTFEARNGNLIASLDDEAVKRGLPDNIRESINALSNDFGIEGIIARDRIENILFSIADNMSISQHVNGKPAIQIPQTLFESRGITKTKTTEGNEKYTTSDRLKFYRIGDIMEDGKRSKTTAMEVYAPSIYKDKLALGKISSDSPLLKLIGFRIPTQGPNSIESIIIKGFLPDLAGDTIVLPTEIVAKAGSDYDVDKLQLYIPNFYKSSGGTYKYITGNKGEQEDYINSNKIVKDRMFDRLLKSKVNKSLSGVKVEGDILKQVFSQVLENSKDFEDSSDSKYDAVVSTLKSMKLAFTSEEESESTSANIRALDIISQHLQDSYLDFTTDLESYGDLSTYNRKVVENKMQENMHDILLHSDYAKHLLKPLSSSRLENLADEIDATTRGIFREKEEKTEDFLKRVKDDKDLQKDPGYNTFGEVGYLDNITQQNMDAKATIGIVALNSTFNILAIEHNLKTNKAFTVIDPITKEASSVSTKIYLSHNSDGDQVELGKLMDKNNKYIPDSISEYASASVDNPKLLILKKLNAGTKTINTVLYLKMAGVPDEDLSYFMNQPIILDYVNRQSVYESQNATVNEFNDKGRTAAADAVKGLYSNEEIKNRRTFTLDDLKEMKKRAVEGKLTASDKMFQVQILDDYLNYQSAAKIISMAQQANALDTASFGNTVEATLYRLELYNKVLRTGLLDGYEDMRKGFLKPYQETMEDVIDVYKPLFASLKNEAVKSEFNKIIRLYQSDGYNKPLEDILDVLKRWKQDFISYVLTTKQYESGGKLQSPILIERDRLFKGDNSVAYRIHNIQNLIAIVDNKGNLDARQTKEYLKYKDNEFLKRLTCSFGEKDSESFLSLQSKGFDSMGKNSLTSDWRKLFDSGDKLGMDIAKVAILQSGIKPSPVAFTEFIPHERYEGILSSMLRGMESDGKFSSNEMTHYTDDWRKNNYENGLIVPEVFGNNTKNIFNSEMHPYYKRKILKSEYEEKLRGSNRSQKKAILDSWKAKGEKPYESIPQLFDTRTYLKSNRTKELPITDFSGRRDYREDKSMTDFTPFESSKPKVDNVVLPHEQENPNDFQFSSKEYTPENIISLKSNEVFVFGSNAEGAHGKGAALLAKQSFGAKQGQSEGLQGNSYAVITKKNWRVEKSSSLLEIKQGLEKMLEFATNHPEKKFLVTKLGSSLAGYKIEEIAKLFTELKDKIPSNVVLPKEYTPSESRFQLEEKKKDEEPKALEHEVENPNDMLFQTKEDNTKPLEDLDKKLISTLNKLGVSVKAVDMIKDQYGTELNAVAKTDLLQHTIEYVEGKRSADTLPEEAAHMIFKLLPETSPLYQAAMKKVEGTPMYNSVLEEYGDLYNHNEQKLKEEAVGKLIAQEILGIYSKDKATNELSSTKSFLRVWFDAIRNWIANKFRYFTSNDLYNLANPYREIAKSILSEDPTIVKPIDTSLKAPSLDDMFYQLSDDVTKARDEFLDKLSKPEAIPYEDKPGYFRRTSEGVVDIKNRVTHAVNAHFKRRGYSSDEEKSDYAKAAGFYGTYQHEILKDLMTRLIEGKSINMEDPDVRKDLVIDVREKLTKRYKNEPGHEKLFGDKTKEDSMFLLGKDVREHIESLKSLQRKVTLIHSDILKNQNRLDQILKYKGEVKFFPEIQLYDPRKDLAGTMDLLVVYSNGAVGRYDYKGMTFEHGQRIGRDKREGFNIQMAGYDNILAQIYGVKDFAECMIIPTELQINRDNPFSGAKVKTAVTPGEMDTNEHLQHISMHSLTFDPNINKALETLYKQQTKLRAAYDRTPSDTNKHSLDKINKAIDTLAVKQEHQYIFSRIKDMIDTYKEREQLSSESDHSLSNDFLTPFSEELGAYTEILKPLIAKLQEPEYTDKDRLLASALLGDVNTLNDTILQRKAANLNGQWNASGDILTPGKETGMLGRIFNPLSDFKGPAFAKLSQMIRSVHNKTREEMDQRIERIEATRDKLNTWAKEQGMSLYDAYRKLYKENKTGRRLVARHNEMYWKDLKEQQTALRNPEGADIKWFLDNTKIAKGADGMLHYEGDVEKEFNEAREAYVAKINRDFDGKNFAALRTKKIAQWDSKYNIVTNPKSALSSEANSHWFIRSKESDKYLSPEFRYIKSHEPLMEYYKMYIDLNNEARALTENKNIDSNFIANIRKDLISRVAQNGMWSVFDLKHNLLDAITVEQHDVLVGNTDPVTGKPIPSIPLIGMSVMDPAATTEDLTYSMLKFINSAHLYNHLKETEDTVKSMYSLVTSDAYKTQILDKKGNPLPTLLGDIVTKSGMSPQNLAAFENFVDKFWYGHNVQNDVTLDVFGRNISVGKTIGGFQNYMQLKTLGLNPVSSFGYLAHIYTNLMFFKLEGKYLDKNTARQAHELYRDNGKKWAAAIQLFDPYTRNKISETGNELAASAIERFLTSDHAMLMFKKPDEMIDNQLISNMLFKYGLDKDNKLTSTESEIKSHIVDFIKQRENGNWYLDIPKGAEDEFYRFRHIEQKLAGMVKGTTPEYDKSLVSSTLLGMVMMPYRHWIPRLFKGRFAGLDYNAVLDDMEQGRMNVLGQQLFSGTLMNGLGEFKNFLGEAITGGYLFGGAKKMTPLAEVYRNKYLASHPEVDPNKFSLEDYRQMRLGKLRAAGLEVRALMSIIALSAFAKSLIPDDKDKTLGKILSADTYMMMNKGLVEMSFFYSPESISQMISSPFLLYGTVTDLYKSMESLAKHAYHFVTDTEPTLDNTPPGYYFFTRLFPFGNSISRMSDMYNQFKK